MSISELFFGAWRNLTMNKMRTFLTMLGIIVSINAAIVIHIAGISLSRSVEESFGMSQGMSTAFVIVQPKAGSSILKDENGHTIIPESMRFTDELIMEYETFCEGNAAVIYEMTGVDGTIRIDDSHYATVAVTGVNAAAEQNSDCEMLQGRFISDRDCLEERNAIVISSMTAKCCFGSKDPVGEYLYIRDSDGIQSQFTVVGVYQYYGDEYEDAKQNMEYITSNAYISYTCFRNLYPEHESKSDNQNFLISGISDFETFRSSSEKFFNARMIADGWETKVELSSDGVTYIQDMIQLLTYMITVIAVLALIIGGMGIMNIMFVSINERTREIGLKKAVGATNGIIIFELLMEAVLISLIGSVTGVITGIFVAFNTANIVKIICNMNQITNIHVIFSVPLGIILFSIIFSVITGAVFGILPALKASRMNVVEALRSE